MRVHINYLLYILIYSIVIPFDHHYTQKADWVQNFDLGGILPQF